MRFVVLAALAVAVPAVGQQAAPAATGATASGGTATTAAGPALPGAVRLRAVPTLGPVSKSAPVNGVLTLYGNERCPTDPEGNEVVVCQRRSAAEQFRVPKELREFQVTPENASWAAKAQGTLSAGVGASAVGSCSVVGQAGQSGCFAQTVRAAKAENQARKDAEARVP